MQRMQQAQRKQLEIQFCGNQYVKNYLYKLKGRSIMGLFTKAQENASENVYTNLKEYLSKKDGNVHVVMVNSFSKWLNQNFQCEDKYTTQIDTILSHMQKDGYEIIDVKFNSLVNQGIFGQMEGYHTLIMYK